MNGPCRRPAAEQAVNHVAHRRLGLASHAPTIHASRVAAERGAARNNAKAVAFNNRIDSNTPRLNAALAASTQPPACPWYGA